MLYERYGLVVIAIHGVEMNGRKLYVKTGSINGINWNWFFIVIIYRPAKVVVVLVLVR